jgi:hypothetical protein
VSAKVKERTSEGGHVRLGTRLRGGKGESKKPISNSDWASSNRFFESCSGLDSTDDDGEPHPRRVGVLGEIERAANSAVGSAGGILIWVRKYVKAFTRGQTLSIPPQCLLWQQSPKAKAHESISGRQRHQGREEYPRSSPGPGFRRNERHRRRQRWDRTAPR